jgi:heme-degrading monooxygenase HmoA
MRYGRILTYLSLKINSSIWRILNMSGFAKTPQPPYYAVIFVSERTEGDRGYGKMASRMVELASQAEGFLGVESARDSGGIGITISYWDSLEAIKNWKEHAAHQVAQEKGKTEWYKTFALRVCKVERDSFFEM